MKSHCPRLTRPGQLHVSRAAMADDDDDHCCSARTPRRPFCSPPVRTCRRSVASVQRGHQQACSLQQRRSSNRSRSRAVAKLGWPSLPRSHAPPLPTPHVPRQPAFPGTPAASHGATMCLPEKILSPLSAFRVHPLALIPSLPLSLGVNALLV